MNHRTVVVADDTPQVVLLMQAVLQLTPCRVVSAPTGSAALQAITDLRPAVAVVDMHLPELTGMEVLRAVRRLPELNETHIILASGDAGLEPQSQAAGAAGFLAKPFSASALLSLVESFLPADE